MENMFPLWIPRHHPQTAPRRPAVPAKRVGLAAAPRVLEKWLTNKNKDSSTRSSRWKSGKASQLLLVSKLGQIPLFLKLGCVIQDIWKSGPSALGWVLGFPRLPQAGRNPLCKAVPFCGEMVHVRSNQWFPAPHDSTKVDMARILRWNERGFEFPL